MNSFSQAANKLILSFEECDTSENSRLWCERMLNVLFKQYVSLGICKGETEYGKITYEVSSFDNKFFIYECD